MRKYNTKAVSFSGLAVALIVVMLFMASIFDVFDYTISAICGIIVTFILVEFGTGTAVCVYAAASILGMIMVPSKINALLFVAFCGWYPFIKRYIERIREPFATIIKLIVFNLPLTAIIFITRMVFLMAPMTTGWYLLLYLVCNFTFIIYDILITKLIWLYVHKYRKQFKIFGKK